MKTLFPHPNGQPGDTSGKTSGHTGKISRLFTVRGTRFTTNRGARATLLVLVFIIVISGALLIRYHTFIVPFRQCSETYQHYAGQPGIEATFIKDFRINDSLSVCATLLEVQDSDTWYRLMHEFNIPIQELNSNLPTDRITIKISPRGHPEISGVTDLNAPIDVITIDVPYQARVAKLELDERSIYRFGMGHLGGELSMVEVAVALYYRYMNWDPKDVKNEDRDRFILSGGHGSALLYSLLHLFGIGDCALRLAQVKDDTFTELIEQRIRFCRVEPFRIVRSLLVNLTHRRVEFVKVVQRLSQVLVESLREATGVDTRHTERGGVHTSRLHIREQSVSLVIESLFCVFGTGVCTPSPVRKEFVPLSLHTLAFPLHRSRELALRHPSPLLLGEYLLFELRGFHIGLVGLCNGSPRTVQNEVCPRRKGRVTASKPVEHRLILLLMGLCGGYRGLCSTDGERAETFALFLGVEHGLLHRSLDRSSRLLLRHEGAYLLYGLGLCRSLSTCGLFLYRCVRLCRRFRSWSRAGGFLRRQYARGSRTGTRSWCHRGSGRRLDRNGRRSHYWLFLVDGPVIVESYTCHHQPTFVMRLGSKPGTEALIASSLWYGS